MRLVENDAIPVESETSNFQAAFGATVLGHKSVISSDDHVILLKFLEAFSSLRSVVNADLERMCVFNFVLEIFQIMVRPLHMRPC